MKSISSIFINIVLIICFFPLVLFASKPKDLDGNFNKNMLSSPWLLTNPANLMHLLNCSSANTSSNIKTIFVWDGNGTWTMNWTAQSSDTSWLKIASGSSGTHQGNIVLSYPENLGYDRSATITITSEGAIGSPRVITVYQFGNPALDVLPASRNVDMTSGSCEFVIKNTGDGLLYYSASTNSSWLTIASGQTGYINGNSGELPSDGASIRFNFAENNTGNERTATVTIIASDRNIQLNLYRLNRHSPIGAQYNW